MAEDVPKPVHPQQRCVEASVRVERLEAALKVLGEEDPDAEPLKAALKQARIHARSASCGGTPRFVSSVHLPGSRSKWHEQRNRSETPGKSRGRWRRVAGSGGFAWRGLSTATDPPRPECPKSGDGGGTHGGNHQIEGTGGRALVSTRNTPRYRVNSPKEGPNCGWHRYRARCRRTERIRSHVDVDRRSRFHFEGSRERCSMIRILFGWRGVRIGEASNPGPQCNARRVPGASQLSGGSTQAAVSRDVRDVLRSVPDSDRTVVDVSDSARSGNRLAPLSEPSGDRRRRLVLVSQQEVPESDHEWDSDTDSIGGASDVEGVDVVEPTLVEDPIILEGRLRAPVRSFASLDAVNLSELFESRPRLMRSVPYVLRGGFSISHESRFPGDFGRSGGQQRSQDSERLEVALGASKNVALSASSRRHSSSQEVGGQAETVPGR